MINDEFYVSFRLPAFVLLVPRFNYKAMLFFTLNISLWSLRSRLEATGLRLEEAKLAAECAIVARLAAERARQQGKPR